MKRDAFKADFSFRRNLFHKSCEGSVQHRDSYYDDYWQCDKCKQRWKTERVHKFTSTEISDRFYVIETVYSPDVHVLIEEVKGTSRYTRLVPYYEAKKEERVKL